MSSPKDHAQFEAKQACSFLHSDVKIKTERKGEVRENCNLVEFHFHMLYIESTTRYSTAAYMYMYIQ